MCLPAAGPHPVLRHFWEFPEGWRQHVGDPAELTDIVIWYPDETPFPTGGAELERRGGHVYERDGWGRTIRRREGAHFVETLSVAIPEGTDPDHVRFEAPELDRRYLTGKADPSVTFADAPEAERALAEDKRRYCVFGKTGGPYLRSTYVRGETQFLMDMAADPALARAIADKMADHLAAVGWRRYAAGVFTQRGSGFTMTWPTTAARCSARCNSSVCSFPHTAA